MRPRSEDMTEIFKMPTADSTVSNILAPSAPAYPTLTIVKGPMLGQCFELHDSSTTIGRDPKNAIFLNDRTVSRKHAIITIDEADRSHVVITDLGSLNGTWVDGAITNRASIKDGSTVQIGTFRMVFHINNILERSK